LKRTAPRLRYTKRQKNYFNEQGFKGKLPSINALKQEWATLDAAKKSLYRDYHQAKDNNRDLQTALYNAERLLGIMKGR
jgi:hypothetical protein